MTIYTFWGDNSPLVYLLLGIACIFAVIIAAVCIYTYVRLTKSQERPPLFGRLLLIIPALVMTVLAIISGSTWYSTAHYEYAMRHGNNCVVQGNVEMISHEEEWHRGTFLGYSVVIRVDETVLNPSNQFSKEILNHFQSNAELKITYGKLEENGITIWEIATVTE